MEIRRRKARRRKNFERGRDSAVQERERWKKTKETNYERDRTGVKEERESKRNGEEEGKRRGKGVGKQKPQSKRQGAFQKYGNETKNFRKRKGFRRRTGFGRGYRKRSDAVVCFACNHNNHFGYSNLNTRKYPL